MSNKSHDDHQHGHKEKGYSNKTRSTWVLYCVLILFFVAMGFILIQKYGGSNNNGNDGAKEESSSKKEKSTNKKIVDDTKERKYEIDLSGEKMKDGFEVITMAVKGIYVLKFDKSSLYDYNWDGVISFKDADGRWKSLGTYIFASSRTLEIKNNGSTAATIKFTKK